MVLDAVTLSLKPSSSAADFSTSADNAPASGQMTFSQLLGQALAATNQLQLEASQAAEQLAAGTANNIHDVMIAAEKAGLAFQLTVQVRNKILDAYQEIMRMQV